MASRLRAPPPRSALTSGSAATFSCAHWPPLPAAKKRVSFCLAPELPLPSLLTCAETGGVTALRRAVFGTLAVRLGRQGSCVCDDLAQALAHVGRVADGRAGAEHALCTLFAATDANGVALLRPADPQVAAHYLEALREGCATLVLGDLEALAEGYRPRHDASLLPGADLIGLQRYRLYRSVAFFERYAPPPPQLLRRSANKQFLHPQAVELLLFSWALHEACCHRDPPACRAFILDAARRYCLTPVLVQAALQSYGVVRDAQASR